MQDWLDLFDDFRAEPVELIDAGEDKVIAVTRISGRAKLSGAETDTQPGGFEGFGDQ